MEVPKPIQVLLLGNRLVKEYGLDDKGWKFDISNSQSRLGVCKHDTKRIEVSSYYFHTDMEEIEDTIRHEIAHALVGSDHDHDDVWRAMCIKVGAKPQRLADEHLKTSAKPNYVIKCPSCNWKVYRFRMKQRNFGSRCPECGTQVKIYKVKVR